MTKIDIARALKDRAYFASLSEQDQQRVWEASPVGGAGLSDADLESVSGGLEGGDRVAVTTTTTRDSCTSCPDFAAASPSTNPTDPPICCC